MMMATSTFFHLALLVTMSSGVPKSQDQVAVNTVADTTKQPCSHYSEAGYRCIIYYLCEPERGLAAAESTYVPLTSKCPLDLELCCYQPEIKKQPARPV